MEVVRENGIAKMLTLLVIHQSILDLSVALVDLDDLPQQDQLAVFSLLRLPRNRKRPIDRIAAHDGLKDIIQALSDIFLHDKPKQPNRVLIFPQSIHPINLHQLPYELMIKNEAILILNHILLHQLLKYSVEPLLNEIYNLRISVDLAGLLFELSGDQGDHEGEETQGYGLEVGLKEMDYHVLNACPFQLLLLDMSETLVIAHQGHQRTLVQREVLELVPNYVLEQKPADGFQLGGGEVCSHLERDQEVDFAGGREVVKAFIGPEVGVYPSDQCCIIRVRAVERAYDIQGFFVYVVNLGVEVGLELVDIVRAPTRSMPTLPFPVLCLPPIMLVNSKSDTTLHRSAHPSHDACQHHHPLIIIQVSIKLDSSMSDHWLVCRLCMLPFLVFSQRISSLWGILRLLMFQKSISLRLMITWESQKLQSSIILNSHSLFLYSLFIRIHCLSSEREVRLALCRSMSLLSIQQAAQLSYWMLISAIAQPICSIASMLTLWGTISSVKKRSNSFLQIYINYGQQQYSEMVRRCLKYLRLLENQLRWTITLPNCMQLRNIFRRSWRSKTVQGSGRCRKKASVGFLRKYWKNALLEVSLLLLIQYPAVQKQ